MYDITKDPVFHKRTRGADVEWEATSGGCIIQTSHELNHDGYFRKHICGHLYMVHVYAWEMAHQQNKPPGTEVHHMCGNRACCNHEHLKLVNQGAHQARHNAKRYVRIKWAARKYWRLTGCNGYAIGQIFNRSWSIGYQWIREWKKENLL